MITVSIVSHGQTREACNLLKDISKLKNIDRVIYTSNIPEPDPIIPTDLENKFIRKKNDAPIGFAENHNNASSYCTSDYFLVLNPDIRIHNNPLPALLSAIKNPKYALVAPAIVNSKGIPEDSARYFPTPLRLVLKVFGLDQGVFDDSKYSELIEPDWVAGMFMLFRYSDYCKLSGFDQGYFLYYEDIDICARIWQLGLHIAQIKNCFAEHDAQRKSHTNLKYLYWHTSSIIRFFMKKYFGFHGAGKDFAVRPKDSSAE